MIEEEKIKILYDHYKDSFSLINDREKKRERLLIFLIIVISFQFLQVFFSSQSLSAFNTVIEKQINFSFAFNANIFSILLWFLLFILSLRYFQTNILVSRQYKYIHILEEKLCEKIGEEDFIKRERFGYKNDSSVFTDWVHLVYTWIFPILLISVALLRISLENISIWTLAIDFAFFIAICTTTILYLEKIHQKS